MTYTYGLKLKCFRKAACLSQEAAAARIGISANTMAAYENDSGPIPLSVFIMLSELYNFDVYDILCVHDACDAYGLAGIVCDVDGDSLKTAHERYMDKTFY